VLNAESAETAELLQLKYEVNFYSKIDYKILNLFKK